MGIFTWTDAVRKPRLRRDGYEYYRSDVIEYDTRCKVICPDDTEIVEPCYDGYGHFGGKDIYELVAEWNKDHLKDIFKDLSSKYGKSFYGYFLEPIARAYQDNNPALQQEIETVAEKQPYILKEWKRNIGIAITEYEGAPYPIKITRSMETHKPYKDWRASISTQ